MQNRADFRQWVFAEIDQLAIPAVLVTHDSQDLRRADSVLILPPGRQIPPNLRYRRNSLSEQRMSLLSTVGHFDETCFN